ncbi:MAG: hypothetical protein K8T20_06695 [Planctomycetes bacterium]|nr:hypothetical protein [Planctomycetota bacterium]
MTRRLPTLFLFAALCGCSTGPDPNTAHPSRPEDKFDVTRPGSSFLNGAVVVGRMALPGKDEPCEYYDAEIENRGASPLTLEVRTVWKDARDKELGAGDWQPLDLAPGGKKTVSDETTQYPEARFVKLEFRPRP